VQLDPVPTTGIPHETFPKGNELRMDSQLEHIVDLSLVLLLQLRQDIEVPGVDYERLLANHMGPHPQRESNMGVM
jgi:hypothetical protein